MMISAESRSEYEPTAGTPYLVITEKYSVVCEHFGKNKSWYKDVRLYTVI